MTLAALVALLTAAAQLLPEVQQVLPIAQKLVSGETVTSQEALTLWTAIVALESQAAAKAAQIEAQPAA